MVAKRWMWRWLAPPLVASVALVVALVALPGVALAVPARVVNGCTIVDNPTPTHYSLCPHANLSGAELNGLNLSYAKLNDAHLNSAQLGGADLNRAHLDLADLRGALLTDAHLTDVVWYNTICPDGQLTMPKGTLSSCPT